MRGGGGCMMREGRKRKGPSPNSREVILFAGPESLCERVAMLKLLVPLPPKKLPPTGRLSQNWFGVLVPTLVGHPFEVLVIKLSSGLVWRRRRPLLKVMQSHQLPNGEVIEVEGGRRLPD